MSAAASSADDAVAAAAAQEDVTWQWLNPRGSWQDFKPNAVQQLEAASKNGRTTCTVRTPAGEVEINFKSMLQRLVAGSSAPRKVRRLAGEAEQLPIVRAGAEASASSVTTADVDAISARLSKAPIPRGVSKAKAAPSRRHAGSRDSPSSRNSNATARGGGSPSSSPARARASSEPPAAPLRDNPSKASAARGSGSSAVRTLRNSTANPGPFADDEALAVWLSTQEDLSDEQIARIYSEHYNRNRRPAAPSRGDYLDIDNMSYEDLLALEERIGYVQRSHPTSISMSALPTRRATSDDAEEENECAVCCDTFNVGDELRILPCFHEFHKVCIDKWMLSGSAGANKCPMCNTEIQS